MKRRKVNYKGRLLRIFQLDREESTYLEITTKGETAKKRGLKMSI